MRSDILALSCQVDESGRPLTGAEQYRIRFSAIDGPPGEAGWRLSAHPLPGRGPGDVIGDHGPLTLASDGGLEILIQADAPQAGRSVNWLRAPAAAFQLTLRLYAPATAAVERNWRMADVERLGSRGAARNGADGKRMQPKLRRTPSWTRSSTSSWSTRT